MPWSLQIPQTEGKQPPQPPLGSGILSRNIQSWNFEAEGKGGRKKKNQGYYIKVIIYYYIY